MSIFFSVLLTVLLLAVVASLSREGLWSNLITLFNVILAGMLATNFYDAAAAWLSKSLPAVAYFSDFVCLWLIFAVVLGVFQATTQSVSKVRVKFIKQVDVAGSWILAIWVGWVTVCFATMTLHTAPLARGFMWNGFAPEVRMYMGLAPDRKWLGLMHKLSQEGFCRLVKSEDLPKYAFDPEGRFIPMWATRRSRYENAQGVFVKDDAL